MMSEPADRPTVVLHGFVGGIVNNERIALRLAKLILDDMVGSEAVAACAPLVAKDHGDRWSVTGTDRDGCNSCRIDLRKSDAAVLGLGVQSPPQVLRNEQTVDKFAAALADNAGEANEAERQLPFVISDRGDTWLVRGSRNAARSVEGRGAFCLEVRRRDGRVLDMSFEAVLHPPQKARMVVQKQRRQRS